MTEPSTVAQRRLKAEILAGGLYESVSVADVQGYINRLRLATTDADRQQLMLDVTRALLLDGLIVVGDIPGPNDPGFVVWPGGVDEVMAKLADRIIGQWTERELWDYSTWLDLTQAGRAAAEQARVGGEYPPTFEWSALHRWSITQISTDRWTMKGAVRSGHGDETLNYVFEGLRRLRLGEADIALVSKDIHARYGRADVGAGEGPLSIRPGDTEHIEATCGDYRLEITVDPTC